MAPLGGLFLAVVGLSMIFGGLLARFRNLSVWTGLGLGAAVAVLFARHFLVPPPPTALQIASLIIAVGAEIAAFLALMPKLHRAGERAVAAGTLAIVGAHFLVMLPALGPLIFLLGLLCIFNAALIWMTAYSIRAAWAIDGAMKLAIGVVMLSGLPAA